MEEDPLTITGSFTMARTPAGSHFLKLKCGTLGNWVPGGITGVQPCSLKGSTGLRPEVDSGCAFRRLKWAVRWAAATVEKVQWSVFSGTSRALNWSWALPAAARSSFYAFHPSPQLPSALLLDCARWIFDWWETVYLLYKLRPQGGWFMYLMPLTESPQTIKYK